MKATPADFRGIQAQAEPTLNRISVLHCQGVTLTKTTALESQLLCLLGVSVKGIEAPRACVSPSLYELLLSTAAWL